MEENNTGAPTPVLQLTNLNRQLGNFRIKNISFTLKPGYIMGLVGKNGAGKSTLMKLLIGVYRSDSGDIQINGTSMSVEEKQARQQIGFVLEERIFAEAMSLEGNADTFGRFYPNYSKEEFLKYCKELKLNPKSKAGKLSKGEYLKFELAFALSYRPKLLLLDEPTGNFDVESRKKVKQMMREFVSDGQRSILYATHLMEELDELADYITYMKQGEVMYSVDKETLTEQYRLIKGRKSLLIRMPKEGIFHTEENEYGVSVLVSYNKNREYPVDANICRPTLEEIIYAQMKREGEKDVKFGFSEF